MSDNKDIKDTDNLIDQLCGDLEVAKPRCPYRRISIWLVFAVVYILAVISYLGLKVDIIEYLSDASFIFEMGLAITILVSAALASSWLSFPDCIQRDWMKTITVTLFSVFIFWIVANGIEEGGFVSPSNFFMPSCSRGILVEAIPFLALVFMTAKGNTTQPYWTMTMNVMAVSALGWIGLRLTCSMYDSMTYGFIHYLLPFCILGAAFGFFARKIFKW